MWKTFYKIPRQIFPHILKSALGLFLFFWRNIEFYDFWTFANYTFIDLHAFFIRKSYFQLSLGIALMNCDSNVAYYIKALSYRDCILYFCLCVYVMVYICLIYVICFFIIIFIFIDTEKLVVWTCLSKVQPRDVA